MKKGILTVLTTIAALAIGLSAANATSVSGTLFGGSQQLSDNSAEILIKSDANVIKCAGDATCMGTLEIGDSLRGVIDINTVEDLEFGGGTRSIGGGSGNHELTGLFQIEVTGKSGAGPFAFTFGPSLSFATECAAIWGAGSCVGAMLMTWDDDSVDFNRTLGTFAAIEAEATDGTPFWLFGLDGIDDFWFADTFLSDNVAAIGALPPGVSGGTFDVALSLLDRLLGPDLEDTICLNKRTGAFVTVNGCGSGDLLAVGSGGADVWNNVDIAIDRIPEPGTLALLGFGLLGLGALSRRRKRS